MSSAGQSSPSSGQHCSYWVIRSDKAVGNNNFTRLQVLSISSGHSSPSSSQHCACSFCSKLRIASQLTSSAGQSSPSSGQHCSNSVIRFSSNKTEGNNNFTRLHVLAVSSGQSSPSASQHCACSFCSKLRIASQLTSSAGQ